MNPSKILLTLAILVLVCCKGTPDKQTTENGSVSLSTQSDSKDPIVLSLDGKTRTIAEKDRATDPVNFDETPLRYNFRKNRSEKGKGFEVTFAFSDRDGLSNLPKTYDLIEDPTLQLMASLSFMDYERKVDKSLNKRLIFNKGKITLYELSRDRIHFEFEGEVHEMTKMENRSEVSGSVNVSF